MSESSEVTLEVAEHAFELARECEFIPATPEMLRTSVLYAADALGYILSEERAQAAMAALAEKFA